MAQRLVTIGSLPRTTASERMRKVDCLGGQIGTSCCGGFGSPPNYLLRPLSGSTDNVAFFSTSWLQISMVGPTKYDNLTVRWCVSEYFGIKAPGMFICHLALTWPYLLSLFNSLLQLPNKLLLHINLPLPFIFALMQHSLQTSSACRYQISKSWSLEIGVSTTAVAEAPQVQHHAKHHNFPVVTEQPWILLS